MLVKRWLLACSHCREAYEMKIEENPSMISDINEDGAPNVVEIDVIKVYTVTLMIFSQFRE